MIGNKPSDPSSRASRQPPDAKPPPFTRQRLLWWLPFLLFWFWVWQSFVEPMQSASIPYSVFKDDLRAGEILEVAVGESDIRGVALEGGISADEREAMRRSKPAAAWYVPFLPPRFQPQLEAEDPTQAAAIERMQREARYFHTVRVEDAALMSDLVAAQVQFTGVKPSLLSQILWSWVMPLILILIFWSWMARRMSAMGGSFLNLGKSHAKLHVDESTGVTFDDVAGCDEAKVELHEVVEFLQEPERFNALGAAIPKGVLLVGPPGTGKTLLARAVAGEARVPFYAISGANFVEMFVGLGAARVRDLFAEAQKKSPCIIFIDEVDTIGRQRSVHGAGAVNDEREQTLNQLLTEMDGFERNQGVIVLAATNRPDVLDPALLRPGRFDRQIVIDAPDRTGREAVLRVHLKDKPVASHVDLARLAQSTPGFSGADLANVVNEAALLAARERQSRISQKHLADAIEKVVAGPERRSRRLTEEERKRVAYHEAGHALVAAHCRHADPVHKISIVPRGRAALGYTLQLPQSEQFLLTRTALLDRIRGLFGGRAAESLVFGEVSTGAENDLEKATALAQQMVCFYGMSRLGLTHYGERRPLFLVQAPGESVAKNCSPDTAREIDEEVSRILSECYQEAERILRTHRHDLSSLADALIQKETIEDAELKRLLHSAA